MENEKFESPYRIIMGPVVRACVRPVSCIAPGGEKKRRKEKHNPKGNSTKYVPGGVY